MEKLKEGLGSFIHTISALFVLRIISPSLKLVSKLRKRLHARSKRLYKTKIATADTVLVESPPEPSTDPEYKLRIGILEAQRKEDQFIIQELQKKLRNLKKGEISMSFKYTDDPMGATAGNKYRGIDPNWNYKCEIKQNKQKIQNLENKLEIMEKAYQDLLNVVSDFIVENKKDGPEDEDDWVTAIVCEVVNSSMDELDQRVSSVRIEVEDA